MGSDDRKLSGDARQRMTHWELTSERLPEIFLPTGGESRRRRVPAVIRAGYKICVQ